MPEIIEIIKEAASKASEDYLLLGKSMNSTFSEMSERGMFENEEILKRACEQANQNVYLSLFNDETVDKSNIIFDVADFEKISGIIRQSENSMKSYDMVPDDFRSVFESAVLKSAKDEQQIKTAELNQVVEYRNVLKNTLSFIETMKTACLRDAEDAFKQMSNDALCINSRGESVGDLSKIACRHINSKWGEFTKIAKAYDLIVKQLSDSNFKVNTEFTKTSSMKINAKSSVLEPVDRYYESIIKVAGFSDMENNIRQTVETFSKIINGEINNA